MRRDIVVVFVHGINITSQDYYVGMRDRLLRALPKADRPYVTFRAVFWADIVRGRQQEYLLYASEQTSFQPTRLHKLVIEGLGDAAAFQKTFATSSAYEEIHERLRRTIRDVSTGLKDQRPLVFIGHSLGCHIISSYAWDMHKLKAPELDSQASRGPPDPPFARLDTFAGLITMGSNQPLFTFNIGPQYVHPITRSQKPGAYPAAFPGPMVDPAVRAQSRWLNFYSARDPLGYPLKPLNEAYDDEPLLTDVHAFSEGTLHRIFMRGWLRELSAMKAHAGYWRNRKVVSQSAQLLGNIINADQLAEVAAHAPAAPKAGDKDGTRKGEPARP